MKKNPEDIAYQVLHEVMFAGTDKKSSDAISKLLKQGRIRRIAPKIYTTNFEANGEDIVRRNIFSILGRLYPGAILSHRSAFECMPTSSGDIFLTYKYSRKIILPGVTVHLLEGPQVDANDRPFIDGLYMSHQTRAFLENMQVSKKRGEADKCLSQQQIEEKLEKMVRVNGEAALNVLRDEARETSERLGFPKEFAKLSQLISAILTTHTSSILRSPLTIARAFGLYNALTHPMARAIMMHVIIAEVHPFDDGNGRMARIMMNAELVSKRQSKVLIQNVFRDDYILALKKFSHQRDISTLVQVLDKMQQYAGCIPCGSFEGAHDYLTLTNAYKEPDEARLIM